MFYSNTLNLIQVGGGTQVKQGDLGSRFSYKLANEKDQELDDFDKEVAHIDLVLNDKIVFTTTATVDNSTVTFNIDKAIPVGLYFLEIKIRDYIFPSDKQTIILVQSGAVAYDLKELVPNYDINMTLKDILSDLSQKGIDISDLNRQMAEKANKDEVTNVMTPKGNMAYASLPMTGNSVGWYYYCPDGDGTHGAGNYVWNGTSWFFGGTGDEGYNLLKKDLDDLNDSVFTTTESLADIEVTKEKKKADGAVGTTIRIQDNTTRGLGSFIPVVGKKYHVKFNQIDNEYNLHAIFVCDANNKILTVYDGTETKLPAWDDFELDITVTEPNAKKVYISAQTTNHIDAKIYETNKNSKIESKVDKISGKGLSTNDYTTEDKEFIAKLKGKKTKKSRILLCFDECKDILTDGRHSLLSEFGYKYTFAVGVLSDLTNAVPFKETVKTLLEYGCDAGIYNSVNEPTSTAFDDESLDWDTYIETGVNCAKTVGVFNSVVWFARKNRTGTALNKSLKKHGFKCCRGSIYGTYDPSYVMTDWTYDDFIVKYLEFYPSTKDSVLTKLDNVIASNGDCCIFTHAFHETEEEAESKYGCTEQNYRDLLTKIKTLVDSGVAEVVTFRDWYNRYYPIDGYENDYNRQLKYADFLNTN